MKISRNALVSGEKIEFPNVQDAVLDACILSPYSYDDQLEKLQRENELLQNVISRLIECIYGESEYRFLKHEKVEYILGYEYEVEG